MSCPTHPSATHLAHPTDLRHPALTRIARLLHIPRRPRRPRRPRPPPRTSLPPSALVLTYPGSINPFNAPEVLDLYAAVALLDTPARPARLVRTGATPAWFRTRLTPDQRRICLDLGFVDRRRLPALLAFADLLVQPGRPGPFNDYRLPSKLPEFLASARPVLLPATNLAHDLVEDREAIFLHTGEPAEIAARATALLADPARATALGQAGQAAARRLFDPARQAASLHALLLTVAARPPRADWAALATHPSADERALFPPAPPDPDLAATLALLNTPARPPAPRPSLLTRLLRRASP